MPEELKRIEIMKFLDEKVFEPALVWAKANKKPNISRGVGFTKRNMARLSSTKMVGYFWNAIVGTEQSITFSSIMKDNHLTRFEDVIEEFRLKFGNNFLNS